MNNGERIMKVETEVKNLKDRNSDEHEEIKDMIKSFIKSADKRYASKWTEKLSYSIIITFATAVVTKIVGLW